MSAMQLALSGTQQVTLNTSASVNSPLLSVKSCGICHSDRKAYHQPPQGMHLPRVLGHEISGLLETDLPGQGLQKGERVALWPALTCGTCRYCTSGRENLCPNIALFGYHLDGGFAEYVHVTDSMRDRVICYRIPEPVSFDLATLAEPIGCILHALHKTSSPAPQSIQIFGAGVMGRLSSRICRFMWPVAKIVLFEPDAIRRQLAEDDGAGNVINSADLIIIATSNRQALYDGLHVLHPGGTVLLFSGFARKKKEIILDHNMLHQKEQTLTGVYGCRPSDMQKALKLLANRDVKGDDLLSSRVPLASAAAELSWPTSTSFKTVINM